MIPKLALPKTDKVEEKKTLISKLNFSKVNNREHTEEHLNHEDVDIEFIDGNY